MKRRLLLAVLVLLAAGPFLPLQAVETELKNQLSGWLSLNDDSPSTPRFGLRWQPTISLAIPAGAGWKLDSELSLDLSASGAAVSLRPPEVDGAIEPYRLWLRLSSSRFEARLGLQKINFGSATVFRPLMWFDRIDPRDPLQLTDGVYGLLLRYYFKGNANLWLWGLYGNPGIKGWETRPTADDTPEFGGRLQVPLLSGEAGVSLHHRRLDPGSDAESLRRAEDRFAVDGKWDLGIGLWVEAAFVRQQDPAATAPWQRSFALGLDYTFKLGSGLYLLAEQYFSQGAISLLGAGDQGTLVSALLARYPLGILDSLNAIEYYDWRERRLHTFISWQRTTDHWQFHLMAFWNPRLTQIGPSPSGSSMFGGKGFQLQVVWNI